MDRDHQEIVRLLGRALQGLTRGLRREGVHLLIADLVSYLVDHFDREEGLMERSGYPEIEAHRAAHRGFLERVRGLQRQAADAEYPALSTQFYLMRDWLEEHVLGTDKATAAYLNAVA
ncbi:MAG: hemerythrin family protein [Deltaproteobacteria bacterium]|nr:hemerythrin family protein [Deltaproteobacteria bacterium]